MPLGVADLLRVSLAAPLWVFLVAVERVVPQVEVAWTILEDKHDHADDEHRHQRDEGEH